MIDEARALAVFARGESKRQPGFEFGLPFDQRAIKEIVFGKETVFFVRLQFLDMTIFEHAGRERQLFCFLIDQECAFHELAAIVTDKDALSSQVE
jgi:hypothetical protein